MKVNSNILRFLNCAECLFHWIQSTSAPSSILMNSVRTLWENTPVKLNLYKWYFCIWMWHSRYNCSLTIIKLYCFRMHWLQQQRESSFRKLDVFSRCLWHESVLCWPNWKHHLAHQIRVSKKKNLVIWARCQKLMNSN